MYNGAMTARVGIIVGSISDWDTMSHASDTLGSLDIEHETRVISGPAESR